MTTKPVSHDTRGWKQWYLDNKQRYNLSDKLLVMLVWQAATAKKAKELEAALSDLETYRKIVDHEVNENTKYQETIARMQCAINELVEALESCTDIGVGEQGFDSKLVKTAIAKAKAK